MINEEDIGQAGQKAIQFSLNIINFAKALPKDKLYTNLAEPMIKSAKAIEANLTKAAASKKDFAKYYHLALQEADKTAYWLCALREGKLYDPAAIHPLINEAFEISKMITKSIILSQEKKTKKSR